MTPPSSPANVGAPRVEEGVEEEVRSTPTKVKAEPGGGGDGAADLINIKVQSQTSAEVFFRIKRNVRLRRLMDMYCGKHSLDPKAVKFLGPDGRHIRGEQTPDEVGLEDGDAIDVWLDQQGGGGGGAPAHGSQIIGA
ncbi:unnamed protein product [Urochloa decumbens]|uniref:Ubiquitin-like domain-containing protein n=1 Tax=Urochloa decumbens TaxID=240449 RepID=A0ABC8Z5Y3_9POAL